MKRPPPCARPLLALLMAAAAPLASATQLVPQNLTQLIAKADVIVMGRVTTVKDGISPEGLPFTEVTLQLSGSAKKDLTAKGRPTPKGPATADYSFRQYGLLKPRKMPDGRYLLPARIEGMPTWTVGEQVISFMNRPASLTGLTTPVGLTQGKLTINGTRAANSFNNMGLFDNVEVRAGLLRSDEAAMLKQRGGGGVEVAVLQRLVQRAVSNNWVTNGAMR